VKFLLSSQQNLADPHSHHRELQDATVIELPDALHFEFHPPDWFLAISILPPPFPMRYLALIRITLYN
jgi:hypothetical protein